MNDHTYHERASRSRRARWIAGVLVTTLTLVLAFALVPTAPDSEPPVEADAASASLVHVPTFRPERFEPEGESDGWAWPDVEDFRREWELLFDSEPDQVFTLVIADVHFRQSVHAKNELEEGEAEGVVLAMFESEEGTEIFQPIRVRSMRPLRVGGTFHPIVPLGAIGEEAVFKSDTTQTVFGEEDFIESRVTHELTIVPQHIFRGRPTPPDYLEDRAYAAALLTSGEPLYAPGYPYRTLPYVYFPYFRPISEEFDPDLALWFLRRLRPTHSCGDEFADIIRHTHSEICRQKGNTTCMLQLRHYALQSYFFSFSFSGPLAESPVHDQRFLLGILLAPPPHRRSSPRYVVPSLYSRIFVGNVSNIARAVSMHQDELVEPLQRWAEDPNLDLLNRFYAATALFLVDPELVEGLDIHPAAAHWIEHFDPATRELLW